MYSGGHFFETVAVKYSYNCTCPVGNIYFRMIKIKYCKKLEIRDSCK